MEPGRWVTFYPLQRLRCSGRRRRWSRNRLGVGVRVSYETQRDGFWSGPHSCVTPHSQAVSALLRLAGFRESRQGRKVTPVTLQFISDSFASNYKEGFCFHARFAELTLHNFDFLCTFTITHQFVSFSPMKSQNKQQNVTKITYFSAKNQEIC